MKRLAVWSTSILFALSAVLAGQLAPRMRSAPDVSPARTTIRVPEDVASLQRAIWLSSPDGLILVKGEHDPVTIDRPLAIVGDPDASIMMTWFTATVGIRLEGPGSGRVTLAGLLIRGWPDSPWQTCIAGGGFDELHVFDSQMISHLDAMTGLGYGGSAVETDVPLAVFSNVYAQSSQPDVDDCIGWLPQETHAAIDAPDSTVIVVDSTLVGGDGGLLCCYDCSCPSTLLGRGGEGGDALVAREAYVANSTLVGGEGSTYYAVETTVLNCGDQPDGVPIVADQAVLLENDLQGAARMQAGAPYTLSWSLASPMVSIWAADAIQQPAPTGIDGWSFLAPESTFFLGAYPEGVNVLGFTVPPVHAWIGKHFVFQAVGLDGTVSRPVVALVTY